MLKYTINIAFLCLWLVGSAQINPNALLPIKEQNKLLERQFFIRLGLDLSRFGLDYLNDIGHTGFEMSMDAEIKYRFFPTIEAGTNKIVFNEPEINYQSAGNYFRFGMNFNMLNYKQRFDRNLFFIGGRFGFTRFNETISNLIIPSDWGNYQTSFPEVSHTAQWFEGVIGIRGELVKNLYMGYTLRVKQMLNHTDFGNITPYWIPGYGKGNKIRTIGMSYSIFYAIPIKKIKPELNN